ncbi:phosphoribosyl-AMP cyclohydrolase [Halobacteriales archaeon SW_7_68_16]|nr:MAG: phosphoribosyl-AMP cyclohydrolase [Halobacteriales archaeon SW_7_68_16]
MDDARDTDADGGDGRPDSGPAHASLSPREGDGGDLVDTPLDLSAGPLPAIAQDAETDEVLMLAYVTRAALERTRETGYAHYYSRSRDRLWRKGEESGHDQRVVAIRIDCDGDAVLYRVEQTGGACHTGHRSCFHRDLDGTLLASPVFDPDEVYDD